MNPHVHKIVELSGSSSEGYEDATAGCLRRAAKTLRDIRWFQVTEQRGAIAANGSIEWQVVVKVAFELEPGKENG